MTRSRSARVRRLRALTVELERAGDAHAALARGEERLRIARELHDAVAHGMTVIVLQAGAARRVWAEHPAAARVAVAALADVARSTLAELRAALRDAPPARLDALDELVQRVRPLGLDVVVERPDDLGTLPPRVDQVAFAVIQEALTNAVRHAAPTTAAVRLRRDGDALHLEVHDAGRRPGAEPAARVAGAGSGLEGLAERVALHGGELTAGPHGDGFRVRVVLPLANRAAAAPRAAREGAPA